MRRLYLSDYDRKIAGVCGGLAEYFGIDPIIPRIAWAVAFFCYGVGLVPYIVCWLVLPREKNLYQ